MQTQLNPSEISELIKKRVEQFEVVSDARNEGTVVSVSDGIARIHGLADAMQGEMIEFPENTFGLALNLERDSVGTVILGEYEHISEGDTVKCTGRILEVPVGEALLGRVVDALGSPIDGQGAIDETSFEPVEKVAPGVIWRQSVSQPVQTGLKSIDAMVPIGRGQRELIIGDRQTGKTAVAIDAIINQKGTGVKCIYVAIGQKNSTVSNLVRKLEEHGAIPWSSNYALLVTVRWQDQELLGIYKPRRGERPLWDFPPGTLYLREYAAYVVSEMIGWHLVPPTVIRDGPYGPGMLQVYIDSDPETHYFLCGPTKFMADILGALEERGVSPDQIHTETFGPVG